MSLGHEKLAEVLAPEPHGQVANQGIEHHGEGLGGRKYVKAGRWLGCVSRRLAVPCRTSGTVWWVWKQHLIPQGRVWKNLVWC